MDERAVVGSDSDGAIPREIGGYRVEGRLGEGGMGEVFLVRDRVFDRNLALKIMRLDSDVSAEGLSRFYTEGRLTGQLQHPVVPPVYALALPTAKDGAAGTDAGPCYYTMKYLRGQTLEEVLERRANGSNEGEWNRQRLLTVFVQICRGVAYAHSRGVIHRDIKPGNIMVGAYGEVYLVDWGLAKAFGRPLGSPGGGGQGSPLTGVSLDLDLQPRLGERAFGRGASRAAPPEGAVAKTVSRGVVVQRSAAVTPESAPEQAAEQAATVVKQSDPAAAQTLRRPAVDSDAKTGMRPPTGGAAASSAGDVDGAVLDGVTVPLAGRAGPAGPGHPAPSVGGYHTQDGQTIGTPQYMAPEQAEGAADRQDHRADIYALGVVLWELITGRAMRDGSLRLTEVIRLAADGWRPEWQTAGRELWIEPDLREIVWKATEPVPADRYQSAEEIAGELQGWLDGRRRWRQVLAVDFRNQPDSDGPPEGWRAQSGVWRVRSGALTPGVDAPSVVHLPEAALGDVRVEIDGWIDDQATGELAALLSAPRAPVQEFSDDGYRLEFGAQGLASHRLVRNGLPTLTVNDPPGEPGVRYRLVAERDQDWLRLSVDGRLVLATRDFFPLTGERLGLYASGQGVHIQRVAIATAGVPRQLTCLAIPDHYAGRGQWREALAEYQRILDGHPGSPEAAEALFKAGQCLLRIFDAKPAGDAASAEQSRCLAEAAGHFQRLQETPLKAWSAIGLAELARRRGGSNAEALGPLLSALRACHGPRDPGLAELVLFMQVCAEAAQRDGQFDPAEAVWRALYESPAVERSTRLRAITRVAGLQGAQRRTTEAIRSYETAMAEFREFRFASAEALLEIGTMHRVAGAPALALAVYDRVALEYPDQGRVCRAAQGETARLLRDQGRLAEAWSAYEAVFGSAEGQRAVQAEALRAMNEVLKEMGRLSDAVAGYQRVVEEYGDQPVSVAKALRELSLLYRELGRKEEANAALRRLLKEFPGKGM